jgi:hypothetical protein
VKRMYARSLVDVHFLPCPPAKSQTESINFKVGPRADLSLTLLGGMATQYEHTFLFDCPNCKSPVLVCRITDDATREATDATAILAHCKICEKGFDLPGWKAKSHVIKACGR